MMTACMLISSLHIPTACGGTGDGHTDFMDLDGDGIHLGIHRGTRHGIMADGTHHGMQVTGAAIGAASGVAIMDRDGITIIHIMDGTHLPTIIIIPEKRSMDFQIEM